MVAMGNGNNTASKIKQIKSLVENNYCFHDTYEYVDSFVFFSRTNDRRHCIQICYYIDGKVYDM